MLALAVLMSASAVRALEHDAMAPMTGAGQNARQAGQLPRTAGVPPLIVLLGAGSITIAFGLLMSGRPAARFAKV
jgi:hypothetical protein